MAATASDFIGLPTLEMREQFPVRHPSVEAAMLYVSVFPSSQIRRTLYYDEAGPRPAPDIIGGWRL